MEGFESHPNETYQNRKQGDTPRGGKGGGKERGRRGRGNGARGLVRRDFRSLNNLPLLDPAKAKIKQKVQEKKTELHRNKEGAGGTGVSGDQK